MKKKLYYLLCVLVTLCVFGLFGCGGPTNDVPAVDPNGNTIITGITFRSQTFTYDGTEKTLLISGNLPEGVTVTYTDNKGTNANIYNASAVLSGEGYQTLTLTATLTINKASFNVSGVQWNYSSAFTYDGTEKSVSLSGLPNGLSVKAYTDNAKTNAGNYTASATFNYDDSNYNAPNIPSCQWTINKASFNVSGVQWNYSSAFTYDGTEKSVSLSGLPNGLSVKAYTDNAKTNAGNYTASATFNYDDSNYNAPNIPSCQWTINKASFNVSGAQWNYSSAFTFDGTEKSVSLSGLPNGLSVKAYTNNAKTNAGNYTASATFNYDDSNYNAPNIPSCQWTINKATMTDITFTSSTEEYDTFEHSINISGNVPATATVKYTCNGQEGNTFTEVGTYKITATVSAPNYYDFTATATLTIKSTETLLYSVNNNGTVYFQNNLDDDKLYKVTSTGISKVNNDNVSYMIANDGTVYYFSSSLFGATIKQLDDTATPIVSANGEYLTTDGTYLYYAINNTLINTAENGIYKIKINADDVTPTRICTDKAKYLTYVNGYIYYSNASENNHLYKVSVSSTDASGSLVWEEKTSYVIADGNNLYFNSSKTVLGVSTASAIYKYITTSDSAIKLTVDNGKYLTKIGDYIYYVNNDLLTSTLFGDGIYRISALMSTDNNQAGEKILSATDNGYSSLTSDGSLLYFYKLNDKRFYQYDVTTGTETNLMKNFTPTDDTNLTGYVSLSEYKGEIYYTNVLDSGYLYKYNPTTKAKFKVIDKSVSTVSFYRDYMYYSTYVVGNYAMFRRDMITGETLKISSSRLDRLIFDGETIYCIKVGSVYNNHIHKMDLDGNNFEKIFSTSLWVSDFYKEGDYIYCVANTPLGKDYVYKFDVTTNKETSYGFKSEAFTVRDGIIYYYDHTDNKLYSYNGTAETVIAQNVTVNDLIVHNGKLYYSTYGDTVGFYAYDLTAKTTNKISDKNADGLTVYNGNIYFVQTAISFISDKAICSGNSSNDGRLYRYDGTSVIKMA